MSRNQQPDVQAEIVEKDGELFLRIDIPIVPAYMSGTGKMTLITESDKFLLTTAKFQGRSVIICSGVLAGVLNK